MDARRNRSEAARWVAFGPFVFDRRRHVLRRAGEPVELPERAARLLAVLVESAGETVSKDRLVAAVWQGRFVSDTSLTEAMSRLRSALGTDAREQRFIRTVHRRGYRFVEDPTPVPEPLALGPTTWAEPPPGSAPQVWLRPAAAALVGLGLAATLGLLGLQDPVGGARRSPAPKPERPDPRYRLAEVTLDGAQVFEYSVPALPLKGFSVDRRRGRVAFAMDRGAGSDAWVFEPSLGQLRRVATGGRFLDPVWRPDGRAVALAEHRGDDFDLVVKEIDQAGAVEVLLRAPFDQFPECWSRDGQTLVFSQRHPDTGYDLWLLQRGHDGVWQPRPLVVTPADEAFGALSPDGRRVAYTTMTEGRSEVFVIRRAGGRQLPAVAVGAGGYPFWSPHGNLLHYVDGDTLLTVPTAELEPGAIPRSRRSARLDGLYLAGSGDSGDRFVVAMRDNDAGR